MKLVRWRRFTWELSKLPPLDNPLPGRYHVRTAERAEERAVSNVILTAFALDSAWSDALKSFSQPLQSQIEAAFSREDSDVVVICHGQRIIAASALATGTDAPNNLLSGPCVSMEYQNRGLGTALLWHSLTHLCNSGLSRAAGVVKDNVIAGKFLYQKFNSTSADCELADAFLPVLTRA